MRQHLLAAMLLVATAASPAFAQYTLTTLASFSGANGVNPIGGLILSGSTLYGTTYEGGASFQNPAVPGTGEVFSLPTTGGTPTVLASFNLNGTNGASPESGLVLSGGTLYGTTYTGGANNDGEVFSVPVTGGTPTVLASFNGTNGANPIAGLIVSGSTLYGTTYYGGATFQNSDNRGDGEVFSLPTSGGTPTVLASFNGTNGYRPGAPRLILSGGTLYGTTGGGGATFQNFDNPGDGEVFSVPTSGGTPTVLASFNGTNGTGPYGDLILSGSTLYGTTIGLASSAGEVFSLPTTGGTPTVLAPFNINGTNGSGPYGGLLLSGGTLYGTTIGGGAGGLGVVFSVPTTGGTPTLLASFNGTNGAYPVYGTLIMDSNGNLYGTTAEGGADAAYNDGTVFELSPTGVPEPVSLGLLGLAGGMLLMRRGALRR